MSHYRRPHRHPHRGPRRGWLSRFFGSLVGALFGAVLATVAVALLFFNEGRVNLAALAASSTPVAPERVDRAHEGRFVSVSSSVRSAGTVSDPSYLRPGPWLALQRTVEMYAWLELEDRGDREPVVRYERRWTTQPPDSRRFRDPRGHYNPPLREQPAAWRAELATVGAFAFAPERATLPAGEPVTLSASMLHRDPSNHARFAAGWLYFGDGSPAQPYVGDHRLSYHAVGPVSVGTVFGEQRGASLEAHTHNAVSFLRLLHGERAQALNTLHYEHRMLLWLGRVGGWLFLWFGLLLMAEPGSAMLDLLPPLGRASRAVAGLLLFPVSLAVAAATVLVSVVMHGSWLTAVLATALLGTLLFWLSRPKPTAL